MTKGLSLKLGEFLDFTFNCWVADNKSLVVVKRPDSLLDVGWPVLLRPTQVVDRSWLVENLNLNLDGRAKHLDITPPRLLVRAPLPETRNLIFDLIHR